MKNVNNDKLIVVNFCNIFIGDGGELFVEELVIDENLDESKRCFMYIMFNINGSDGGVDIENEESSWKENFDYNGDVIEKDSEEMKYYIEDWNEKKKLFLSKRKNNEKLVEWSVEYDKDIGFVVDDKIEEVKEKLLYMYNNDVGSGMFG